MKACASAGEESRMSLPTAMVFAPRYATKAAPMARAASSFTWSGYVPRMSYALKMSGLSEGDMDAPKESKTAVVGEDRFVPEHDTILHRCVAADVAMPPQNGAPDHRFLADTRAGPQDRALDSRMFFDVALPADDAVGTDSRPGLHDGSFVDEARPFDSHAFVDARARSHDSVSIGFHKRPS